MGRHSLSAEESVEAICIHGLYRLEIELANGTRIGVAVCAEGQLEMEGTLTREYGKWKLIRDKNKQHDKEQ